ncbi:MAG: DUF1579 family protein [Actinomycetota bacterium]
MTGFDRLLDCVGIWRGTNWLYLSPGEAADESSSVLHVMPVLGGQFVRLDQTWGFQGDPQQGSLLVGYDADSMVVTAHWIDTFHMGRKVLECTGAAGGDALEVRGSYPAPPGPDWGWRISVSGASPGQLEIVMFNIHPDGQEDLAVKATYSPE